MSCLYVFSALTHDNLDKEEGEGEAEHADQPAFLPRVSPLPSSFSGAHLDPVNKEKTL